MLSLYRSSDLKLLAEKLLDKLDGRKCANPLQRELIILQNNGMKRWLKLFIAKEEGIAANIGTEFPAEFIWKIYHQMDGQLPEILPSEKEPMQFAIFDILQAADHEKKLKALYRYIQADTKAGSAKRAWHLSGRIADLFERYQIYRPEMILKWQQNKLQTKTQSERWQAELWQMLRKRWESQLPKIKHNHRVELNQAFLKAIKNNTLNVDRLPGQLNIFAVPEWPPVFLEAFIELSKVTDVHFYWLDVVQKENNKHPIIQSWGKNGYNFLNLFHQYVSKDKSISRNFNEKRVDENKEARPTLLETLQDQILAGKVNSKKSLSNDSSVQVHSCHSPLREVEVLYDQLLALFEEDPELNPDEITIMCTDPELYAPVIEAVFGHGEEGLPEIPCTVINAGKRSSAGARAFIKILELLQSRFNVTDIITLLQMPVFQQKMNINYEDVARLERWIGDNNIRWGIDGEFKRQFGLPEDNRFTWKAGLSRLMLGYAMQQEDTKVYNELVPYDGISGSSSAELLGIFYEFINKLFVLHANIRQRKTIQAWIPVLHKVINDFFPQNPTALGALSKLNNAVEQLEENAQSGGLKQKVPFKIVHSYLERWLEKHKTGGRFGSGVTFSSMVGLQNIPFKVTGILGMNENAFPRLNAAIDFDLIQQNALPGDPDQAETDRYLFLNTLMGAGQTFYISYSGQSNRQNIGGPPSVLVSELLNTIEETLGIERQNLVTHHRLQPFSSYYFKTDTDLFSFSNNHLKTAKKLVHGKTKDLPRPNLLFDKLPSEVFDELTLNNLITFYQNPSKFILQNRFGIYLKKEEKIDEDRELFTLDNLEKYKVKQQILQHCFAKKDVGLLKNYFTGRDMLPVQGDRAFQQAADETHLFYKEITHKVESEDEIEFKISLQDTKELTGKIGGVCGADLLLFRFGKLRPKDIVEWWLKHVVWNIISESDASSTSFYYSFEDDKVKERSLAPLEDAESILNALVKKFREGIQHALPFFPETSFTLAQACQKGKNLKKALEEAEKSWKDGGFTYDGEIEDPYNKLIYKNFDLKHDKQFEELAKLFFEPYFKSMEQGA